MTKKLPDDSAEGRLGKLLAESYYWIKQLELRPPEPVWEWPDDVIADYSRRVDDIARGAEDASPSNLSGLNEFSAQLEGFCAILREAYGA